MAHEELIALVKEYLSEMANPAPCFVMRSELRRRMAKAVGVEDPAESLRKWNAGSRKATPR